VLHLPAYFAMQGLPLRPGVTPLLSKKRLAHSGWCCWYDHEIFSRRASLRCQRPNPNRRRT
jgi:hypothetical protein